MWPPSRNLLEVNLWISDVSGAGEGSWARAFAGSGRRWIGLARANPWDLKDRTDGRVCIGLAMPGVISVAQSDCMFPEWFGPGSTFASCSPPAPSGSIQ